MVLFGYLNNTQRFAKRDPKTGEVTKDMTGHRVAYRLYRTPQLNDYLIIRRKNNFAQREIKRRTKPLQ